MAVGCSEAPPCVVSAGNWIDRGGSGACLIEDRGNVLVVSRRFDPEVSLPGGVSRPGETSQCTAHREVWEETGFVVVVGPLLETSGNTSLYQCELANDPTPGEQSSRPLLGRLEVDEVLWLSISDLRAKRWRYPTQRWQVERLTTDESR